MRVVVRVGGRSADDLNLLGSRRPLGITPAAKLSAGMKTESLSPDNLGYKVGKISHREICPAEI